MMTEVSIEEMVEFIYDRCADDLTEEQIEMVLELQQSIILKEALIRQQEKEIEKLSKLLNNSLKDSEVK